MKTEQEKFWKGEFGDDYIDRNSSKSLLASNLNLFSSILKQTKNIKSMIEFGCNIGMNLKAIELLIPDMEISGIEINKDACKQLQASSDYSIINESIIDFEPKATFDFCLIKGVLIHINPDSLTAVYKNLYYSSKQYICVAEYYNPTPVSIPYRGHKNKLFKRDFAGEMLDLYPDLELIDYGFYYRRDPVFPKDDLTWFLLEKKN